MLGWGVLKTDLSPSYLIPPCEVATALHAAGTVPAAVGAEVKSLLHGIRLSAQAGGQDETPPERLLVVPWGLTQTHDGPLLCDAETLKILPERQRQARADRIAIDLDHGSAFGANKGQPRHVAGYGTPRVVEGEGIWLYDIRWTPTGKQFWANYEDLSPAILQQKTTGRVTFIDSVALTPRGMIEGLGLFSAEPAFTPDNSSHTSSPHSNKPPVIMNPDKLKSFLKARGIEFSETATVDELAALVEAELEKIAAEGGKTEAPAEMSAGTAKAIKALSDEVASLKSAEAGRHKAGEDARKAEIIRVASAAGKVLPPDEVINNMSADDLQKTADAAPGGTVKTSPAGVMNPALKNAEKTAVLSAEDKEIARQCGLGEEDMQKFAAYGEAPVRLA